MAQGSSNPTVDIRKIVGTVVDVNTGSASAGTQRVVLASNQTVIPVNATQATTTLSGVQITGLAGQFSCTAGSVPLTVGSTITISGTFLGTGSISGYASSTIYKISATNGSTTFTLVTLADSALTTTTGTPSGLTYTVNIPQTISNITQFAGKTISMGTGTRDSGTLRVTLSTDDSIGITQSGTWNIGTVSTVTNLSQLGGQNIAMGTGTRSAGTLRVTVATDDVVPVSDNGGSLTVDNGGTFAVQAAQSGTWSVTATQSTPASLQVTATQAVGSAATRWYAQISDGTNSPAVKAASTSAVAADPSLTVALSPNMPVNLNANSNGYANPGLSVKSSSGTLFLLTGYSNKTSNQYVQIFNTTSAPSAGATPTLVFIVPPQSNFTFDFGIYGRNFSTGIYVINSTTATTYTAASADCVFDAQYR